MSKFVKYFKMFINIMQFYISWAKMTFIEVSHVIVINNFFENIWHIFFDKLSKYDGKDQNDFNSGQK